MHDAARRQAPLWRLLVALLPEREPEQWFTLSELAPLLGISRRALNEHARDLWPHWEGQFRLNHEQAVALVRRVSYAGRKLPSREDLEARLQRLQK